MLDLAAEDRPGIFVSTLEVALGGVRFTIDTLRALRTGSPPCDPVFLCGSDALADVTSWREHEALLSEFDFAAVGRPDDGGQPRDPRWPDSVVHRVVPLPSAGGPEFGLGGHVYVFESPALAVSSSLVRARLASGGPVSDLVPASVGRYIQRHRLYSEEVAR
jgi:nicotinate-nucleotide adenylyltransferase